MLRASGDTIERPHSSDLLDIFVDQEGNLVVLLIDVQTPLAGGAEFVGSLMLEAQSALSEHAALHTVVSSLEMQLAARPGVEAGLIVLRVSQRDAKVEVLNAGMPAIAKVAPSEQVTLYPALSGPLGRRVGEVHPYELIPLAWGSTWLAVSDGVLNGSLEPEAVSALCTTLQLADRGLALTSAASDEQNAAFQSALPALRFTEDDATFALVSADPNARFKSGMT